MAITPVSASNSAVNATQALRPQQDTVAVQRAAREYEDHREAEQDKVAQAPAPKPTVNGNGQTVGTIVNITA